MYVNAKKSIIIKIALLIIITVVLVLQLTGVYRKLSLEVSLIIGICFSIFPVSVAEIVMLSIPFCLIIGLIYILSLIIKKKSKQALIAIKKTGLTLLIFFCWFYAIWGHNYSLPFSQISNYSPQTYSMEDLIYCCTVIFDEANYYAENHEKIDDIAENKKMLLSQVSNTFSNSLLEQGIHPIFRVKPPKMFSFSSIWESMGIDGMYFPFTGEASVLGSNKLNVLPYRAAHEMCHNLGIAREDEANFAAFLFLQNGSNIERYSAFCQAWVYVGNELAECDFLLYCLFVGNMSETLHSDLGYQRQRVQAIEENAEKRIADIINDSYLKSQGQVDGIESYNKVVAYLVDWVNKNYPKNAVD